MTTKLEQLIDARLVKTAVIFGSSKRSQISSKVLETVINAAGTKPHSIPNPTASLAISSTIGVV